MKLSNSNYNDQKSFHTKKNINMLSIKKSQSQKNSNSKVKEIVTGKNPQKKKKVTWEKKTTAKIVILNDVKMQQRKNKFD